MSDIEALTARQMYLRRKFWHAFMVAVNAKIISSPGEFECDNEGNASLGVRESLLIAMDAVEEFVGNIDTFDDAGIKGWGD